MSAAVDTLVDDVVAFWKREFALYEEAGGHDALEQRPVAAIARALLDLDSFQSPQARAVVREYVQRFTGLALPEAAPRRVLVAASESGVWASELTLVASLLLAAGHEVKVATETGQAPHLLSVSLDPAFVDGPLGVHVVSREEALLAERFMNATSPEGQLLLPGNTLNLGALVRPPLVGDYLQDASRTMRELQEGMEAVIKVQESFDALVIAGGSGAVAGFAMSGGLHHLVLAFHRRGKPLAAECNGVFALVQAIDPATGHSVLWGRLATTHSRSHEYRRGGWGWAKPNTDGSEIWTLPGADGNPIIDSEPFVRNAIGPDGIFLSPPQTPYAVAVDGHLITARTTPDGAPAAIALIALLADPNAFPRPAFMGDDSGFQQVQIAATEVTRK